MSRTAKTPRPGKANSPTKVVPPKTLAQWKNLATRNPAKALLRPDLSPDAFREIVHAHIDQTWFFGKTNGLPRKPRHLLTPGAILAAIAENPAWPMVMLECPDLAFDLAVLRSYEALHRYCANIAAYPLLARRMVFRMAAVVDIEKVILHCVSAGKVLRTGFEMMKALADAPLDCDTTEQSRLLRASFHEMVMSTPNKAWEGYNLTTILQHLSTALEWGGASSEARLHAVCAIDAIRCWPLEFRNFILWPTQVARFLRIRASAMNSTLGINASVLDKITIGMQKRVVSLLQMNDCPAIDVTSAGGAVAP